jgi:serine/threonine-protein kinase
MTLKAAEQPPGQVVAGHLLHRLLGSGAHGTVYLASPVGTNHLVALKLLPLPAGEAAAHAQKSFLETAAAAQALKHPDVVAVLNSGVQPGLCWLAMEPVPGAELGRYARAPRLLPESLVLRVCQRLARALAHAHRQGVVHRDVKPANVLVDWPTDTVKLTDFGIARLADSSNTATGMMLGSPAYMSPEQLAGGVPTARSDLYALGVTLFELLAGRPAYAGATMGELLRQVAQDPPPDLAALRPDLPPALVQVVGQLLAKAPAQRPADGDTLADRLEQIARLLPESSTRLPGESLRTAG